MTPPANGWTVEPKVPERLGGCDLDTGETMDPTRRPKPSIPKRRRSAIFPTLIALSSLTLAALQVTVTSSANAAAASNPAGWSAADSPTLPGHTQGRYRFGQGTLTRAAVEVYRPPATVQVGPNPFGIAISRPTGSVYVANASGVAVFDGSACNARTQVGCTRTAIAVPAGAGGIGILLDDASDTVYVANGGDGTVSVVDAATCNVHLTAGCSGTHPSVTVGSLPSHLAIDQASHTLYVANEGADAPGNTLSMIDTSTCNGHVTTGCGAPAPTAPTGAAPDGLIVDPVHHTLYVTNGADNTISVLDTRTCNVTHPASCPATAPVLQLAGSPVGGAIDPISGTLLVPTTDPVAGGDGPGWLSVIDTAMCNADVLTRCGQNPARAIIGSGPIDVAVNATTRRAYAVNESDSSVSVIDLRSCNATRTQGCARSWPMMAIGFDGGATAVDPATDTVYTTSQERGTVTVLDGASCTATRDTGCRHPAPTTGLGLGPAGSALDQHTRTLYVANQLANTVSVVDPDACNARNLRGCSRAWPTTAVGQLPKAVAVDESLDTLYTANQNDSTVSVIDTRTCNSHQTSGCGRTPQTIAVTGGAFNLTLDPGTHTLYIANINSDTVSVINTATCNARVTTGCGQAPHTVRTGNAPAAVLLDPSTGTLYVSNNADHSVAVVNSRTCNSTTTTGCATAPPTVATVDAPRFLTIDPATATVYVSIRNDSSLAMIDTRRCNARATAGCAMSPAVVHVGFLPYDIADNPRTGRILIGNVGDSTVSSFSAATCNAHLTTGCSRPQPTIETGGWPTNLTVDQRTGTLYVSQNVDLTASLVPLSALD
jgi:YVTN family beta-propeller protein